MKVFLRAAIIFLFSFSGQLSAQTPVANFTATPLSGCAPLIVQFTSTSTGNPTSYQWTLGNGVNTVQQNPSTAYTTPGTYTVTLTVTNANGSDTKTVTNYITVVPAPTISFSALDTDNCPPFQVQFVNSTTFNSTGAGVYNWSFGDGNTSALTSPQNIYYTPGQYTVTLVATNGAGCTSSLTKPGFIKVFSPPVGNITANPTSYCGTPANINFTASATGTGPYTYNWDYGDGGTGVGVATSHVYNLPGIYTITLYVTDGNGCMDTVVKPNYVAIGTLGANFTTAPVTGCANVPVQFNNTSAGGTSYFWNFGDGNTSTLANPTHTYAAGGTYNVKLAIYDGPCGDSVTLPVTINPAPNVNFSFTPNQPCPAPTQVQFNNLSNGATSYYWNFGDGNISNLASPSHTYATNNYFPVGMTATNAFGCSSTKWDTIKIHSLGVYVTPANPKGCVPFNVGFGEMIYAVDPITQGWYTYPYSISSYSWNFGDGGTSNSQSPSHTYVNPNNVYNAALTVTTSNGCTATGITLVSVGDKPTASFIGFPDTLCVNTKVHFVNTTTDTVLTTSYTWQMGDGNVYLGKTPDYAYTHSGIYNVSLIASNFGCTDTFTVDSAAVILAPTAIWSEKYSCDTPLFVQFYDTLSVEPTSHIWYFGDGNTDTSKNPGHLYASLGTYTVSLVTFNNIYGCSDTETRTIELIDPALDFVTPDTAICQGDSILFTPSYSHTPSGYTWLINGSLPIWPYGPASNPNPSSGAWGYRFNQKGIYDVSVYTTDIHGCNDTTTRPHYVLVAKPQVLFSATPTVGCVPMSVLFEDTSVHLPGVYSVTRNWNFGNGTATTTNDTISNLYPVAGIYNVTLTVTDNVGCTDVLSRIGYIDVRKPVAAFSVDDSTACIGQQLTFTNASSGVNPGYLWDFGDGTTSTNAAPVKSYSQTGLYDVKLIVTDASGCQDSLIKTAWISVTKPDAQFASSDTQALCPPLSVVFNNLSVGGTSYAWDFGNGSLSALQNPTTIYATPNLYQVSLVVTNADGCTDTAYGHVNVLGYAGGLSYTPVTGCSPLTVEFQSNIYGVATMIWDFNDGVTAPLNGKDTISHTFITPGKYLPQLILSDNAGCTTASSGLDTIYVDSVWVGFVAAPPCVNTPVVFTDTSYTLFAPISGWVWKTINGQTSTAASPSFVFPNTGSFPVTLIAKSAWGCTDSVTRSITIYDLPVVTAAFDTLICKGDATTISAAGANTYSWLPSTGLACATCQSTSAAPVTTTPYVVTGTDQRGCKNKDTVVISVKYVTTSFAAPGGGICADSIFQLKAWGADRFEWSPSQTLDDYTKPDPIASPDRTTTYVVTAWEASCLPDTHQVKVIVYPRPDVDAGKDDTIMAGTSVVLIATSSDFVSFLWSPETTLSCTSCTAPSASPRVTTTYKVIATSDKGCRAYDSVTIHLMCDNSQVFIPNTFTPNNDGQNDVFYPRGEGMKSITSFRIYNRWGELVFERRGFQLNDASSGWDGTSKGATLGSDIFIYSIEGICDSGETLIWKGDVTLLR